MFITRKRRRRIREEDLTLTTNNGAEDHHHYLCTYTNNNNVVAAGDATKTNRNNNTNNNRYNNNNNNFTFLNSPVLLLRVSRRDAVRRTTTTCPPRLSTALVSLVCFFVFIILAGPIRSVSCETSTSSGPTASVPSTPQDETSSDRYPPSTPGPGAAILVDPRNATTTHLCVLAPYYPDRVDIKTNNFGRMEAIERLRADYAAKDVISRLIDAQTITEPGFASPQHVVNFVISMSCMLVSFSTLVEPEMREAFRLGVKQHPETRWMGFADEWHEDLFTEVADAKNALIVLPDTGVFYLAGIVLGSMVKSSPLAAIFLSAHPVSPFAASVSTMIANGMQVTNPNSTLYALSQLSFDPIGTKAVASMTNESGALVVLYYSRTDSVVASTSVAKPQAFTIGLFIDQRLGYGDHILASVVPWKFGQIYYDVLRVMLAGFFMSGVHMPGLQGGWSDVTGLSDLIPSSAIEAFYTARDRIIRNEWSPLCQSYVMPNGTVFNPTNTCIDRMSQLRDGLPYSKNIAYLGLFKLPTDCALGTRATYIISHLKCVPCEANTYSATLGAIECLPCPQGTVSEPGATTCTSRSGKSSAWTIAVVCSVVTTALIIGAVHQFNVTRRRDEAIKFAPKENPVVMVSVRIDWGKGGVPEADSPDHRSLRDVFARVIRAEAARKSAYVVAAQCTADMIFLALRGAYEAVLFSLDLQEAFLSADYPEHTLSTFSCLAREVDRHGAIVFSGLRVSTGIHVGHVTIGGSWRPPRWWSMKKREMPSYTGNHARLPVELAQSAAGGQTVFSQAMYDAIFDRIEDLPKLVRVRHEGARRYPCVSDGSPVEVYSILAKTLLGRRFPPIAADAAVAADISSSVGADGHAVLGVSLIGRQRYELRERARQVFPNTGGVLISNLVTHIQELAASMHDSVTLTHDADTFISILQDLLVAAARKAGPTGVVIMGTASPFARPPTTIEWKPLAKLLKGLAVPRVEIMVLTAVVKECCAEEEGPVAIVGPAPTGGVARVLSASTSPVTPVQPIPPSGLPPPPTSDGRS
eukprot:PhM_4_TR17381/c0_g1_i1/m.32951